jgi:MFS family permease
MKLLFFRKVLNILLVTNGMILLAGAMLGPIYALFVEEVGGDLLDASLAGVVFAIAAGVTTLISGRFTDKVKNRELIVVLGYIIMGVGYILYTKVNSVLFLLVVQMVIGLGEAVYAPAFDVVYSTHLEGRKTGKQWGVLESLYYFTAAGGALIGGLIVTRFGFKTLFVIMSVLCFASALYVYRLPRKKVD